MNEADSLIKILERISKRIETGSNNLSLLHNLFKKRVELESRYAAELATLIPQQYDQHDPVLRAVIEEFDFEAKQHKNMVNDIQSNILIKIVQFLDQFSVSRASFQSKIKNHHASLAKKLENARYYHKAAYDAENQYKTLPVVKQPKQLAYIEKMKNNLTKPMNELETEVNKVQQIVATECYETFSKLESSRFETERKNAMHFTTIKAEYSSKLETKNNRLVDTLRNIDVSDKTHRYVERVFNPTLNQVKDDDEIELHGYAIYDFFSDQPYDLSFEYGDKIRIILQHNSNWWEGELNGNTGFFPNTHIMIPKSYDDDPTPICEVFLVKSDFIPLKSNEIAMKSGDLVYVEYINKSKCSGKNLRTQKRGYFPFDRLEVKV